MEQSECKWSATAHLHSENLQSYLLFYMVLKKQSCDNTIRFIDAQYENVTERNKITE